MLGRKAVKKPKFDFRGTTESAAQFAATAQVLEDTGVAGLRRARRRSVKADAILEAALAIHSVEARHAGWIRDINGAAAGAAAFDEPLDEAAGAGRGGRDTRFIVPRRRRRMSRGDAAPRFAG